MIGIDLTRSDLFQSLIEMDIEGEHIDLHNNYSCIKILFDRQEGRCSFDFKSIIETNRWPVLSVIFEGVILTSYKFYIESVITDLTLDNFYRGRFQEGDILKEYSEEGKGYFYLEFYEGFSIELLSNKATFLTQ